MYACSGNKFLSHNTLSSFENPALISQVKGIPRYLIVNCSLNEITFHIKTIKLTKSVNQVKIRIKKVKIVLLLKIKPIVNL
jgi:hypothetical protein